MGIYIYGAGMMGEKYLNLIEEKGFKVSGFLDTYKQTVFINGERYPIIEIKDVDKDDIVIISILDIDIRDNVENRLKNIGINAIPLVDFLYKDMSFEEKERQMVADFHILQMDDYFEAAESNENMSIFWGEKSIFRELFDTLDLENVVEIACGRGRHVNKYVNKAKKIILIDCIDKNIEFCKKRYQNYNNIEYYCNNGKDLSEIKDNSVSSVFSYDSFVHFEMMDILYYLREIYRVLNIGGKALIHHSNNTENYKIDFNTGKMGRNYMSQQLFAFLAWRSGLSVVFQKNIDWSDYRNLDCITLLRKDRI